MKAINLAAGMGTRLGTLIPKPLTAPSGIAGPGIRPAWSALRGGLMRAGSDNERSVK